MFAYGIVFGLECLMNEWILNFDSNAPTMQGTKALAAMVLI